MISDFSGSFDSRSIGPVFLNCCGEVGCEQGSNFNELLSKLIQILPFTGGVSDL